LVTIHARRVAMPSIDNNGDVNIDNIARLKRFLIWDAVADDFIDRGANGMLITPITKAGGNRAVVEHKFKGGFVKRRCGYASLYHWDKHI